MTGLGQGQMFNSASLGAYNLHLKNIGGNDCEISEVYFNFIANSTSSNLNLQSARLLNGSVNLGSEIVGLSNGQSLEEFDGLGITLNSGDVANLSVLATVSGMSNGQGDYISTLPYWIQVKDTVTNEVIPVTVPWQAYILSSQ